MDTKKNKGSIWFQFSKESRINIVQNNYLSSVDKVDCQVYEFEGYFDPAETLDQAFSACYSKNGKW